MEAMDDDEELREAYFSERLVAFMVDGLLFYGLFLLNLKLTAGGAPMFHNPWAWPILALWTGLFVLYHAGFAAAGRPTIGKELLGLRVLGRDGKPLPAPRALARSLGYFLSSFFNLGFLWALVHPEGRAWHDLLAGSKVVCVNPRPYPAVLAGALASVMFLGGTFVWQNYGAPRFYRVKSLAYAQVSLESLGQLQEVHRQIFGIYSNSLVKLVRLSPEPKLYLSALGATFDADKGIRISVHPDGKSYTLTAYARDVKNTRLTYQGPAGKA